MYTSSKYILLLLVLCGSVQVGYGVNYSRSDSIGISFCKRYLQELNRCNTKETVTQKLKEDRVILLINDLPFGQSGQTVSSIISDIQNCTSFTIQSDSLAYRISWKDSCSTITCSFRREYELLLGKSKPELEKLFIEKIKQAETQNNLTHDTVYLISENKHPEEVIKSLFLSGYTPGQKVMLQITHLLYGKERQTYTCSLATFLSCCQSPEFTNRTGIETDNGSTITGTVIFRNQLLGYNHVLYFACPIIQMATERLIIKADLYTYIPTHNIENIFKPYEPRKKKQL